MACGSRGVCTVVRAPSVTLRSVGARSGRSPYRLLTPKRSSNLSTATRLAKLRMASMPSKPCLYTHSSRLPPNRSISSTVISSSPMRQASIL